MDDKFHVKSSKKEIRKQAKVAALAAKKANTQQGTAMTTGENGQNMVIEQFEEVEMTSTRKAYKMQPVYAVCKMAKAIFMRQLVQNIETKRGSIKVALAHSYKEYPDALRFHLEFKAERDRLTDSKRFCNACEARGLNPEYVADNIVLEGKGVLESVIKDGLQIFGEGVMMFNAPLFEDTEGLYSSANNGSDE